MEKSFTAVIKIINGNPYVETPLQIRKQIFRVAGTDKGPIPVHGTIEGAGYTQTLVRYQGAWRLYVNGIMLKAAGIKYPSGHIREVVGKKVSMTVVYDPNSRTLPLHPQLEKALQEDRRAQTAYDALAPYRKHEINRYLGFLKTDSSIQKNIQRILAHLRGEEVDALYPLMHRKKQGGT